MIRQDDSIDKQWRSVANTWRAVSGEASPPPGLTECALDRAWPVRREAGVRLVPRLAIGLGAVALMGLLVVLNGPQQPQPDYLAMEAMQPVNAHQLRIHDSSTVCREPQACLPREMTLQLEQPGLIGPAAIDG